MDTYNRFVRVRRWVLAAVIADGLLLVQSHSLIAPSVPEFLASAILVAWGLLLLLGGVAYSLMSIALRSLKSSI